MNPKMKYIPLALFILLYTNARAQYLANPSFEGPPGIAIIPPAWFSFDPLSTPDTEPLDCDDFSASDGVTYITLVARGAGSNNPQTVENCQAQLLQPLTTGQCYSISLDLASRNDLGHYVFGEGFKYYTSPSVLRIYGSTNSSEKGVLFHQTDPVVNRTWETISFSLKPDDDINYLLIEATLVQNTEANGNVLVDKLSIGLDQTIRVMFNDTLAVTDLPFTLEASESSSYSWSPTTGLSCYDCRTPEVYSTAAQTYTCSLISNSTSCPEKELFILYFEEEGGIPSGEFKIPNVFTPNGDGINDRFEVSGLPPLSSLIVFDRSGKEVFRSEEYKNEWNGTDLYGTPLAQTTYWYVLITPGLSGKHKGSVYLKRD
jgi:gliding motility-associated-like protein